MPAQRNASLVRFGVFELDARSGDLRRAGARVRLSGQPLVVLLRLVERPGELVSRDDLRRELWAENTFVDFERNLNSAVKRLRAALGDSATTPRFIETVPKRGYRFLPAVQHVPDGPLVPTTVDDPTPEPAPMAPPPAVSRVRVLAVFAALVAVVAIGAVATYYWSAAAATRVSATDRDPGGRQVYERYLRGRYHLTRGTEQDFLKARQYFEQAIATDPTHAPSHSGLADYYVLTDALPPHVALPRARIHAGHALALDALLVDAHVSLAFVHYYGDWAWDSAERAFTRALELDPNHSRARRCFALLLAGVGRHDEAKAHIERALAVDPVSMVNLDAAAAMRFTARAYDEALLHARQLLGLDPADPRGFEHQSLALFQKAHYASALASAERGLSLSPHHVGLRAARALCLARLGRTVEAREILQSLDDPDDEAYVSPFVVAAVAAELGHYDLALDRLDHAYEARDPYMVLIKESPLLDSLRSTPRFRRVADLMKFPD